MADVLKRTVEDKHRLGTHTCCGGQDYSFADRN
jgi:hypothetical protein